MEVILQLFMTCNTHTKRLMQLTLMKLNIQGHFPEDIFLPPPNIDSKSNPKIKFFKLGNHNPYIHDFLMFQALS